VHYIHDHDAEAFEVARAIKDNKKIYDEDRRKTIGQYHIVDGAWIMDTMKRNGYDESAINQWIDQTQTIADSIDIQLDMGETLFPNYEVSDDIQALYKQEKGNLVV
jgi:DNA polymerase III alpha subunit